MINEILDLVKQYGQRSVVENPDVPNEYNNVVMSEAASTITGGLQNMLSGGGLQGIINMFSGNQNRGNILNNPIVSMMVGHLANKLVGRLNLNPGVANTVANSIIPGVIGSLINKTRSNAPEDSNFDLNDLIGAFTGGGNATSNSTQSNGIDFQDILNQFAGGNQSAPDLSGVIDSVTQRAQQNQHNQQGGGITDLINSFFK